ncbi:MAG: hypothetical protein AAF249_13415 [Pseudomonadota bacterium]
MLKQVQHDGLGGGSNATASFIALFLAERMAGSILSGWAMDHVYATADGWVIPWPWDWF